MVCIPVARIIFYSCKKDEKPAINFHFGYFGLTQGRYVEYDVMEINHDAPFKKHDTTRYRLKTLIGEPTIDNSGRTANVFYRSIFNSIYQTYEVKDAWTAIIDEYRAELVEENQRIIKLVFSPTKYKEWNMNAFNSFEPLTIYYSKIHEPYEINGFSFDSTVTVLQDSIFDMFDFTKKYEVYAKGIGLIKKHYQEFTIQNFDISRPLKGTEKFYSLVGYGME